MLRRPWILFLAVAMAMFPSSLFSADLRARLDLRINQKKVGEIEVFFRGDDIMAPVMNLNAVGIGSLGGRIETIHGVQVVSLKSLVRELSFAMNEADLSLRLTLKQGALSPKTSSEPPASQSHASPVEAPIMREMTSDTENQARLVLYLEGTKKGEIAVIVRGQDVLARLKDIAALGGNIASSHQEIIRGETYVSFKSLPADFVFSVDEEDRSLRVTSRPSVTESIIAVAEPTPVAPVAQREELARQDSPPGTDQRAIFAVKINEIKKRDTDVVLRGEDVFVRVKDLQAAGMALVNGPRESIRGESYVSLRSLAPSLSFSIDEKELALDLTVSPDLFGEHTIALSGPRPEKLEHREDTSGFVNYGLTASNFKSLEIFSEVGVTVKNALLYSSLSGNSDGAIVRGLSNVTINDRGSNNRTIFGDRLVNSDFLGGSITMGGLSYLRDFALDPYFIRNPGLDYSGAVSTPSTLDVYSNGRLIRRVPLPAGQFQLKDLPVPAGSNDTHFIIRDAFGRERELGSQFFYFTSGLLKSGLHDFSYNFGSRRDDLATKSWGYGAPVLLGHHRYGFSDYLTAGLRLEGSKGLMSGGPSFSFLLPFGEMELASAASTERGVSGGAAFIGYSYIDRLFSFGSSTKVQSEHYATTSLRAKKERSWLESGAYAAFTLNDLTAINLRYGFENSREEGLAHKIRLYTNTRLSKNISLLVGGNLDLKGGQRSLGFSAGLILSLGVLSGSLSYQNEDGAGKGILDLRKSLPIGPGYGYGLQASTKGDVDSVIQYQTSFGRYEANYNRLDGRQQSELRAAGGLAFIDGSVKFTRPVQDSFALVKVPGLSGIRGYLNNLEIGTTDSQGRLFVPNLLSYYGNNLSISRKDLPFNYNIDSTDKIISAPYRGGALVEFPAARIQRVVGKAVIESGGKKIIPKYDQLTITGQGQTVDSPLGNDGEFYFENLKPGRYQAQIETQEHTCEFYLDVPQLNDETIQLGTLTCSAP